jgi:hypothetical protein
MGGGRGGEDNSSPEVVRSDMLNKKFPSVTGGCGVLAHLDLIQGSLAKGGLYDSDPGWLENNIERCIRRRA